MLLSIMVVPASVSNFSISMPVLEYFVLNGLYNRCKVIVISQCGFGLYFPENYDTEHLLYTCWLYFYLWTIVSLGPMLIFK